MVTTVLCFRLPLTNIFLPNIKRSEGVLLREFVLAGLVAFIGENT